MFAKENCDILLSSYLLNELLMMKCCILLVPGIVFSARGMHDNYV